MLTLLPIYTTTRMTTKQEYLRRYASPEKADNKKKKKSTEQQQKSRLKIIDADIDLRMTVPQDNGKVKSDEEDEDEAPLIAAVIDERPEHVKKLEAYRSDPRWKTIASKEDNVHAVSPAKHRNYEENTNQLELRKEHCDSGSDQSPIRKQRHDSGSDQSPIRKQRHDSDSDQSPIRNQRHDSDSDQSPIRKQHHDAGSDQSPIRKQHHDSDSDQSPIRKQYHVLDRSEQPFRKQHSTRIRSLVNTTECSYKNIHFPSRDDRTLTTGKQRHGVSHNKLLVRKKHHKSDKEQSLDRTTSGDQSPVRRKRQESSNDKSLVRRKRHRSDSDQSPVRRKRQESSSDHSPVRRKRHGSDSDQSPVRRKRQESSSDHSPVRRKRHGSDSDQSPVRRKRQRSDSDHSPVRRQNLKYDKEPAKLRKMASGVKAGLQDASVMRSENTKARTREDHLFEEMDPALSGKLAKPVYRDRETGKKRDFKAERREKRKEEKQKAEEEGRYLQWGKGVKQKEMQKEKLEEDLHEMSKPLARYRDDADLDEMLRGQERAGDPMLAFIKKKQSKRVNNDLSAKPKYRGPQPPPNRYGLMPGYRWDGVDRSNGFEKEFFQRMGSSKARETEAYKWSVEDM